MNSPFLFVIIVRHLERSQYYVRYPNYGRLSRYYPVSTVTVLGFVNPVMGVILSAIFLHEGAEALSIYNLIALVLVSLGIYIINKKSK